MNRLILLLIGLTLTFDATAAPASLGDDPRIRLVPYDPNRVVALEGVLGFQTMIEFGSGERIENVSIGDSLGWQVTPNRKATLLFLKPIERDARTNMTVVTNLRRYMFDLSVRPAMRRNARPPIYGLRFNYLEPFTATIAETSAPEPPEVRNQAYSYQGSTKLLPTRVFDDGRSTYFVFDETTDHPAIFVLDGDRKEALADVSARDGYFVVNQIAAGFVLRRGEDQTRIVNDGYREFAPAASSLQPAPKSRRSRAK